MYFFELGSERIKINPLPIGFCIGDLMESVSVWDLTIKTLILFRPNYPN